MTASMSDRLRTDIDAITRGPQELLDDLERFVGRFVAYPSEHARIAHVLWIAHTHAMDAWESTPRISFLSPEPASGKSRALEVTELLVPRPVEAVNVTPTYLFRKVGSDDGLPTILYDEIDTVFGPKAKENEEIRGLLNAGHRRHAKAGRCVVRGNIVQTEEISAYCAVALAGLGALPDTILTRSVVIPMRRRAPGEYVQPFRRRDYVDEGHALRDRLEGWASGLIEHFEQARPALPDGIADRDADVWEPLLAIADAAGGLWPERARAAAVALVTAAKEKAPSLGVRLLSDLRKVFGERHAMATEDILKGLVELDESPWGDIKGKPIDARWLAHELRQYEVKPDTIRVSRTETRKGYKMSDLLDVWTRYLPPLAKAGTSVTSGTEGEPVTPVPDVPDSAETDEAAA